MSHWSYAIFVLGQELLSVDFLFSILLVELALEQSETLKMQSFFLRLCDLVCRPRVPSEDRGNWG